MQYIFLAVVIVMALLNGFMYIAVKRLADSVGKQIRSQSLRLFSIYNQVQTTTTEDHGQVAQGQGAAALTGEERTSTDRETAIADIVSKSILKKQPQYRNARFASDYITLKKRFNLDKDELMKTVIHQEITVGPAAGILDKLSLDSVYKLSSIDAKNQEKILKDLLTQEQISYIDNIMSEVKEFDIAALYYKLRMLAQVEDGKVHVLVPEDSSFLGAVPPHIAVESSQDICEGVQVLIGNTLYDYSIGKREIG